MNNDKEYPKESYLNVRSCPKCHRAFLKMYIHSYKEGSYYECPNCGYSEEMIPTSLSLKLVTEDKENQ